MPTYEGIEYEEKDLTVYDYQYVPTIRKFTLDNMRHRFVMGPFGSGKSVGCLMDIVRRSHEQEPSPDGIRRTRWAIVRNTYPQLKDTTIKTVFDWLPPDKWGTFKTVEHDYIVTGFDGVQMLLMFRALDQPEHVRNLLSMEITGAWMNEYREIEKDIFEAIDGRIGRYPAQKDGGCTWMGILADSNPCEEDSYWYNYLEKLRPKNAKLYKQPSGLSPNAENIRNLPRGYYYNLAEGKTENYVNVYIHGKYGYKIEGKLIYQGFNDNLHTAGNVLYPMRGRPLLLGFDFALNPTCVIGQTTPRGQLIMLDELQGEGMGLEQFLINIMNPLMQTKYQGFQIVGQGDPSGNVRSQTDEKTCYQVLKDYGYKNVQPARTNGLISRHMAVEGFLGKLVDGQPGLVLSPNCGMLRKGFNGGYRRKKIPGLDEYYEIPDKNVYSHYHDALQYLCMGISDMEKKILAEGRAKKALSMGYRSTQSQYHVGL